MNKVFFDELNIPEPDYHLGIGSGSHGEQTGEMLKRTEEVLRENIEIAEQESMIMNELSLKPEEYYLATQKFIDLKIQMLLKS
jgi:UDP-N-acetylglucosamine 2-epimerase